MPKPKFEVVIYWSEEDQAFIAEVPELPGYAADGKMHREALHNVKRIIQEWLETPRELAVPSLTRRADWSLPEMGVIDQGAPQNRFKRSTSGAIILHG